MLRRLLCILSVLALAAGILLGAAALFPLSAASFLYPRNTGSRCLVIGHRGAPREAPENTLASFARAIEIGADGIECDVLWTRDNVPVVCHHNDVTNRFPGAEAPVKISEMTFSEVSRLDAGSWFDPIFAGEKIPSLRETLSFLRDKVQRVYLHDKPDNIYKNGQVGRIAEFAKVIRDSGMAEKTIVMVESDGLELWRGIAPDVHLLQCWIGKPRQRRRMSIEDSFSSGVRHMGFYNSPAQLSDLGRWLEDLGVENLGYLLGFWPTRRLLQPYANKGCDFTVFTINDPLKMHLYLAQGFHGIGTDDPGLLIAVRDGR